MTHTETLDRVESLIVSAVGVDRWEGMPGVDDLPALDRALGELDLDAGAMRQVREARRMIADLLNETPVILPCGPVNQGTPQWVMYWEAVAAELDVAPTRFCVAHSD